MARDGPPRESSQPPPGGAPRLSPPAYSRDMFGSCPRTTLGAALPRHVLKVWSPRSSALRGSERPNARAAHAAHPLRPRARRLCAQTRPAWCGRGECCRLREAGGGAGPNKSAALELSSCARAERRSDTPAEESHTFIHCRAACQLQNAQGKETGRTRTHLDLQGPPQDRRAQVRQVRPRWRFHGV